MSISVRTAMLKGGKKRKNSLRRKHLSSWWGMLRGRNIYVTPQCWMLDILRTCFLFVCVDAAFLLNLMISNNRKSHDKRPFNTFSLPCFSSSGCIQSSCWFFFLTFFSLGIWEKQTKKTLKAFLSKQLHTEYFEPCDIFLHSQLFFCLSEIL